MTPIVIDTNIFLAALLNENTGPRQVLRMCLNGEYVPLMGNALLSEYEDIMSRTELFKQCPLDEKEREQLLNAFVSVCHWVPIYYLWRPNLKDEADNHLIELALAGNAKVIISRNKKDFRNSQLLFPQLKVVNPSQFLQLIEKSR